MCGIVGFSIKSLDKSESFISSLAGATSKLSHRGPDNDEIWIDENKLTGLGHTRLSIIDLTNAGNQPMKTSNQRYVISFNGEIYNFEDLKKTLKTKGYIFNSNTDTEVLLNGFSEWSTELFQKINGMYAISIFDTKKEIIYLARDPAGQKPLYYSFCPIKESLIFGSELKALKCFPSFANIIDHRNMNKLFSQGYCNEGSSIYKSTFKVQAGTYLKYKIANSELSSNVFWSTDKLNGQGSASKKISFLDEDYLVKKLHSLLQDSINSHLRADVPVGLLLSGGIDSSIITAIASDIRPIVNTYTVRFSQHQEYDESIYATQISKFFNTEHHELDASILDPSIIDRLVYFYDEPIFDTSTIPTFLLFHLISSHCKVAVGGDGGDELFGGYPHYNKLLRIKNHSKFIPLFLRKNFSDFFQASLPIGYKGKKTLEFFGTNLNSNYPNIAEFFSFNERQKLFNPSSISVINIENQKNISFASKHKNYDFIQRATEEDFNNFLREDILVKVDRASMANSLEIRSPFLDKNILNFAFHEVPSSLKATPKGRKILLKKLAKHLLPHDYNFNRKQGFSLPLRKLVHEDSWRSYFIEKIDNCDPSIFNKKYALDLMNSQHSRVNNAERLLAMIFFMAWVEKNNPTFF